MADQLFKWPDSGRFGKRIPKEKIYQNAGVSSTERKRFVEEVSKITWAYKLADHTINLPASEEVAEVVIIEMDANDHDVSEEVLEIIDKAISHPVVFEINRTIGGSKQTRMVAAHKHSGPRAQKLSRYFSTEWQPSETERVPLPPATNLANQYTALLAALSEVPVNPGEDLISVSERLATIEKLKREISTLQRKHRNEKQLNRRIELRRAIKTRQDQLDALR